jgi:hypothetical protein
MMFLLDLDENEQSYAALRAIGPDSPPKPICEHIEHFMRFLEENEKVCDDTTLSFTASKIGLIHTHIKHNVSDVDFSSLAADCRNIRDVLMAELWKRKFAQIPKNYSEYVENEALFGAAVKAAFPSASEDIKQAGNCLAVECGTASVFHLMRAVEWGLRALCRDLGIIRIRKKKTGKPKYTPIAWTEWQDMLEEAHKRTDAKILALKAGKRKQDAQEFYYPLLRDLRGFKEAFRNHVMHTRAEYTPTRAEDVLDHVQRFMTLLSTRVKE